MPELKHHIVVGGLQRSGTSLFRAILGSHSQITMVQWDLPLWIKFFAIYGDRKLSNAYKHRLIESILAHHKFERDELELKSSDFEPCFNQTTERDFFLSVYVQFMELYRKRGGTDFIGIKTPFNEFFAPSILDQFPKTHFFQLIRNPLDTAASFKTIKKNEWGGRTNFFEHLLKWKESVEIGKDLSKRFPSNYKIIRFEDLIDQPEKIAQEVCSLLELPFEPAMLEMKGQPGWKGTNSSFQKSAGRSINADAQGKYQNQLDNKTIGLYAHFLREELNYLNYSIPETQPISALDTWKYQYTAHYMALRNQFSYHLKRTPLYYPLLQILRPFH